jgi:hypothetical protein
VRDSFEIPLPYVGYPLQLTFPRGIMRLARLRGLGTALCRQGSDSLLVVNFLLEVWFSEPTRTNGTAGIGGL